MYVFGYPLLALVNIIDMLLLIYSIVVLLACILSFTGSDPRNQLVRIINNLTYPVFVYCRKFVPSIGMVDLSPIVIFLMIAFIRSGILPIFGTFAQGLIH